MRGGAIVAIAATAACELAEVPAPVSNGVCDAPSTQVALPSALAETSGVAASSTYPGTFWVHNDSGSEAAVFAVDSTGRVLARVRVDGATNRDWEDIATGPCEPGDSSACLFIGEIGDNSEHYPHVAVYRIPEPDPATDSVSRPAEIFRFRYHDGPRDAESVFVTDTGIHIVSKGRSGEIGLFRLAPPYRPGATVDLTRVQRLAPPPTSMSAQITAAAADPAGQLVVIRSYAGLRFFRFEADTLRPHGRPANVVAPTQMQGEGVDFLDGTRLVVTSEAQASRPPSLALLTCDPTRPPPDTTAANGV